MPRSILRGRVVLPPPTSLRRLRLPLPVAPTAHFMTAVVGMACLPSLVYPLNSTLHKTFLARPLLGRLGPLPAHFPATQKPSDLTSGLSNNISIPPSCGMDYWCGLPSFLERQLPVGNHACLDFAGGENLTAPGPVVPRA